MNAFIGLIFKEFFERRLLLLGAGLLGLGTLVLPLIPGLARHDPQDLMSAGAMALGLPFTAGISVVLGSSMLNSDLFSDRMSFYFSRPLRGFSFWAARVVGGIAIAILSTLLVFLPALLLGTPLRMFDRMSSTSYLLWLVAGTSVLVTLSHFFTALFRDRSPWLLLNVFALAIAGLVSWSIYTRVMEEWLGIVSRSSWWGATALAGFVCAAAASAIQTLLGRGDLRHGRRLFSVALVACLTVAVLADIQRSRRLTHPTLDRIRIAAIQSSSPSGWHQVLTTLAGDPHEFNSGHTWKRTLLWNSEDNRYLFLPPFSVSDTISFSADGRYAAWAAGSRFIEPVTVTISNLSESTPLANASSFSVSLDSRPSIAISHSGDQLAIEAGGEVHVYSTLKPNRPEIYPLAEYVYPYSKLQFTEDGALSVYWTAPTPEEPEPSLGPPASGGTTETQEPRTRKRNIVHTTIEPSSGERSDLVVQAVETRSSFWFDIDPESGYLFSHQAVIDPDSLEFLWSIPKPRQFRSDGTCCVGSATGRQVGVLHDGSLVMGVAGRLDIYPPGGGPTLEGGPARTIAVPNASKMRIIAQVGPNEIITRSRSELPEDVGLWRIRLDTGEAREIARGFYSSAPHRRDGELGILGVSEQRIARIDLETEEIETLLELAGPTWKDRLFSREKR